MDRQAEMLDSFAPGELQLKLAYKLLSTEDGISRRILYELLGRPKRSSDLRSILPEVEPEDSLTDALEALRMDGLVEQRTDARDDPVVHRYEVTPLGIQVVLSIQRVQPIDEQLGLFKRIRAAGCEEGEGSP